MVMETCVASLKGIPSISSLETLPVIIDTNNNAATSIAKCEKYSLRPRTNKKGNETNNEFEVWKPRSKYKVKVKQKPAPLSKYRRKSANARERCRMREINEGFEALRRVLPNLSSNTSSTDNSENNEKLTKISTLRLAMKYIAALNRILHDTTVIPATVVVDVESNGESLFSNEFTSNATNLSDQSLTLTPPLAVTLSDQHSFCTNFSNQLLSPSDFTSVGDSILSNSCDLDQHLETATSAATILAATSNKLSSGNDIIQCDFLNNSSPSSIISSSSQSSSSSMTSDIINPLDSCLPEIHFDEGEYNFDNLSYISNLS